MFELVKENRKYLESHNVQNFQYPVRIRWSRQPILVPFYLFNRIFECPENIRNYGFPDVRWPSRDREKLKFETNQLNNIGEH